jgi:hypothetical protein
MDSRDPREILVVVPWTIDLTGLRASLRAEEIHAIVTRVDLEPALEAALTRTRFDAVVYLSPTPSLALNLVETAVRVRGRAVPVVVVDQLAAAAAKIAAELRLRRN